jgi:hypothetical protein
MRRTHLGFVPPHCFVQALARQPILLCGADFGICQNRKHPANPWLILR